MVTIKRQKRPRLGPFWLYKGTILIQNTKTSHFYALFAYLFFA